ncbi:kinase-like domain-containing protein [Aspergillus pseudonomiae]|uniref:Kinase-like domain-containing protein n=1 Tax=Aspergillus pseudonomiae TaxID=1506151 RepID=A0A5N6I8X5_9EURO|nr:kinase-like domain-containing protein [Aspergillus pseudonomiae]KAB8262249.1 kinase-like domain-containing protein [Aspergillus pseudonomiae]KAE8397451.1 kinase-like domain-containing protein [Aspergillus pseudonomiae]
MISDGTAMTTSGSPHDVGYVRAISRQLLLGLDFLHQSGIVHCDLQPANMMFSVTGTTNIQDFLQPPEFSPVKWLEGTIKDDSPPKYLMPTQRRRGLLDNANWATLVVSIGDLGGAQWIGDCDEKPVTPLGLRAPELVQQDIWDAGIDIWCLGCSVC